MRHKGCRDAPGLFAPPSSWQYSRRNRDLARSESPPPPGEPGGRHFLRRQGIRLERVGCGSFDLRHGLAKPLGNRFDGVFEGDRAALPRVAPLPFEIAVLEVPLAHDDAERNPQQVGIGELDRKSVV